jgi:flagellar biosynthesis/type III secretory pathway M-ring protein FliF/YscJ
MDSEEQTVEIMVCAFIALGIIITAGYFMLQKSGVSDAVSISEDQIKEVVTDEQYPDFIKFMSKQSIIYWIIGLIVGVVVLIIFYIMLTENMAGLNGSD